MGWYDWSQPYCDKMNHNMIKWRPQYDEMGSLSDHYMTFIDFNIVEINIKKLWSYYPQFFYYNCRKDCSFL